MQKPRQVEARERLTPSLACLCQPSWPQSTCPGAGEALVSILWDVSPGEGGDSREREGVLGEGPRWGNGECAEEGAGVSGIFWGPTIKGLRHPPARREARFWGDSWSLALPPHSQTRKLRHG